MYATNIFILISSVVTLLGFNRRVLAELGLSIPLALFLLAISSTLTLIGDNAMQGVSVNYYYVFLLFLAVIYLANITKFLDIIYAIIVCVCLSLILFVYHVLVDNTLPIYSLYFVLIFILSVLILCKNMRLIMISMPISILLFESLRYMWARSDSTLFHLGSMSYASIIYISMFMSIILKSLFYKLDIRRAISII